MQSYSRPESRNKTLRRPKGIAMTMREDYEKWIKDEDADSLWSLYKSAYIAGQKAMRERAAIATDKVHTGSAASVIRALPIEGEE